MSCTARVRDDKVRGAPERFADHHVQATLFFESQTPTEPAHIAAALRFELSKITLPAIGQRMVAGLDNASPALAAKVAEGLGMQVLEPLRRALAAPATPEIAGPPMLPLMALMH